MWRPFELLFACRQQTQNSWIRKVNDNWMSSALIALSITSFAIRYIEDPVTCWCPKGFKSSMVKYVNNFCWRSETYYLHYKQHPTIRIEKEIKPSWERWLPLILFLQSVLFKIPGTLMSLVKSKFGMKESKLHGLTDGYIALSLKDRTDVGKQCSSFIGQWLRNRIITDMPFGILTILTIFVYILYIANITAQLVVFDRTFKDQKVISLGTHLKDYLLPNGVVPMLHNPTFYRIFLCDLAVINITAINRYTFQCFSNINLFYEEICFLVWILLVITAVVTYCCCAVKLLEIVLPFFRIRFVKCYLESGDVTVYNDTDVWRFANSFLGEDGVTILRHIAESSSEFLVRDIIVNLWNMRPNEMQQVRQYTLAYINQPISEQVTDHNQVSEINASGEEAIPLVEIKNRNEMN